VKAAAAVYKGHYDLTIYEPYRKGTGTHNFTSIRMATMKTAIVVVSILAVLLVFTGCSGGRFHKKELPNPASYQAHFPDMDDDGNESVTWNEFQTYFPQATPDVFEAIDLNQDKGVDHDEWHEFKEAHGMKSHH
jgi:hypothetical protein